MTKRWKIIQAEREDSANNLSRTYCAIHSFGTIGAGQRAYSKVALHRIRIAGAGVRFSLGPHQKNTTLECRVFFGLVF